MGVDDTIKNPAKKWAFAKENTSRTEKGEHSTGPTQVVYTRHWGGKGK